MQSAPAARGLKWHVYSVHVPRDVGFRLDALEARAVPMLERIDPSPLRTMNRAVAIAEWQGPDAGLAALDALAPPAWLVGSYLWDAVLGDLHRRAGHLEIAQRHRDRALAAAPTDAVRALLRRRLTIAA
jgi:predicted RNA polymerase sigma factor